MTPHKSLALIGLAGLIAAGCVKDEPRPRPARRAVSPPSARRVAARRVTPPRPVTPRRARVAATRRAAPRPPARRYALVALPAALGALGKPCLAHKGRRRHREICGKAGHVSVVYHSAYGFGPATAPGERVFHKTFKMGSRRDGSKSVWVQGHQVWAKVVTCHGCRVILGWTVIADLRYAAPVRLQRIQVALGLPKTLTLDTAHRWRHAWRVFGKLIRSSVKQIRGLSTSTDPITRAIARHLLSLHP